MRRKQNEKNAKIYYYSRIFKIQDDKHIPYIYIVAIH